MTSVGNTGRTASGAVRGRARALKPSLRDCARLPAGSVSALQRTQRLQEGPAFSAEPRIPARTGAGWEEERRRRRRRRRLAVKFFPPRLTTPWRISEKDGYNGSRNTTGSVLSLTLPSRVCSLSVRDTGQCCAPARRKVRVKSGVRSRRLALHIPEGVAPDAPLTFPEACWAW
jgi:hypothetical protein